MLELKQGSVELEHGSRRTGTSYKLLSAFSKRWGWRIQLYRYHRRMCVVRCWQLLSAPMFRAQAQVQASGGRNVTRTKSATHYKDFKLGHTILYYTILYYTILYYTILYYTILYYTILYYTILYYTILYYTILYYTILYYTILYYTILYYTILYCPED